MTNLVIKQGTDLTIEIPDMVDANGVPITNWTNFSVKAQVRERVESATVLHEWSTAAGNAELIDSKIVLVVARDTSTPWTWTHGRYDVELTNPAGQVTRVAEGHVIVSREVTR